MFPYKLGVFCQQIRKRIIVIIFPKLVCMLAGIKEVNLTPLIILKLCVILC